MHRIVQAIPEVEHHTGRAVTVVGGLAVICRLGAAHRATGDLDTVNRRSAGEPAQLDVLIAAGARPADAAGVLLPTPAGLVKVDILEVADWELSQLPDDPTDRLHVLSHAWGAATASAVQIHVTGPNQRSAELVVRVAESGPLVAMKLQSVMNRPAAKEGTDLVDIVRLVLDPDSGPSAIDQLSVSEAQLASDAALHAKRWFVEQRERTLKVIRAVGEQDIDADSLDLVAELLLGALDK